VWAIFGSIGFFGWFYSVPEYVLTYGFLVTFAVHCVFMQRWREILGFLELKRRYRTSNVHADGNLKS
jgi:hypothetical protein